MSGDDAEESSAEAVFARIYAQTFDGFVRHVRQQGIPLSERLMDAAHERATTRATHAARARGFRSVNFTQMAESHRGLARARYGY